MKFELSEFDKIMMHAIAIGLVIITVEKLMGAPNYFTYAITSLIFVLYLMLALINDKLRGWNDYQSSKVKK